MSTTGADPAAQRDSRGEKSHPRASPQQSCSLGAFCSRVDTETWVRLKSPHDRGTAAAPSSLAPIMGAEHCPLEMVTQKTSWETGSAWMSQLHPLLDLCWGWGRAGSGRTMGNQAEGLSTGQDGCRSCRRLLPRVGPGLSPRLTEQLHWLVSLWERAASSMTAALTSSRKLGTCVASARP